MDNLCLEVPVAPGVTDEQLRAAIAEAKKAWYPKSNERAMHDFSLPAIVRGFIALHQGPATEVLAIEEAGFMPKLYAKHEGRACEITLVSAMGDIGVDYLTPVAGAASYARGISVYDLTDFSLEGPVREARQAPMRKLTRREKAKMFGKGRARP
ncbi:hypothetical protein CcrBL47_gp387 [Caulobacter phage BL47]|nr:hypothetical protein CcrBL47_gp387 [Caulobacter phage BL47]